MKNTMTTQRKIRKDFDLAREYSVDVSACTKEEKEEVLQGFFDVGFSWWGDGEVYKYLDAEQYSNALDTGEVVSYLLQSTETYGCNMSAKRFLYLVYELELEQPSPGVKALVDALEQVIKAAPSSGPLWHGSEQIAEARAALATYRRGDE